jgi:hypothetical protein
MENSLSFLANDLYLRQSELFGEEYKNSEVKHIHTFNDLSISDLDDWCNCILVKYDFLNELQITNFLNFLNSLNYLLTTIDPNKLKINDTTVENTDLMLWRESDNGMSMITFDIFGQIAYAYIGKDGKKVRGTFDQNIDMEKLLYKFISM